MTLEGFSGGQRLSAAMTQEQIADLAGISRPRYRDIETGAAAARATTLMNIARALGLEMMFVPQAGFQPCRPCCARMMKTIHSLDVRWRDQGRRVSRLNT